MSKRLDQTMGEQGKEPTGSDSESFRPVEQWSDTVNLPTSELSIPFLSVAQSNSPAVVNEQAKMGQWILTGFPAEVEIVVVPLRFAISRSYMVQDDKGNWERLCYSPPGAEHGIGTPGIPCDQCELKDWTPTDKTDERGRIINQPPSCKMSYDFIVWSQTHESLARLPFRGSGLTAGRQIATLAQTRGLGQFPIKLNTVRRQRGNYVWAVPNMMLVPQSEWGEILPTAQAMFSIGSGASATDDDGGEEIPA